MDQDAIEEFKNITTSEDSFETSIIPFLEICFVLIRTTTAAACAFIVCIILKFKRLKTVYFLYILNWNIADFLFHSTATIAFIIFSTTDGKIATRDNVRCINLVFYDNLQITVALFVTQLSVLWFLSIFFPAVTTNFKKYHCASLVTVWIFTTYWIGDGIYGCFLGNFRFMFLHGRNTLFVLYCLLSTVIIVSKCIAWRKDIELDKTVLALTVIFVANWLPPWLVTEFGNYDDLLIAIVILVGIGYLNSIFNLIILAKINDKFKQCLLEIYRKIQGYEDASHPDDDWEVNLNIQTDVVSIDRQATN